MKNPWLAKNPALSLWLSAFNAGTSAARGPVALAMQRQMHALTVQGFEQAMRFWSRSITAAPLGATRTPRRRK